MPDREKSIKGLEWILENDRFGFGVNWEIGEPRDEYEKAGKIITDTITLLQEQEEQEEREYREEHPCEFCQEYLCDGCPYDDK